MEGPATNGGARSGSQTATTDAVVAKWLKQYPAEASSQEANRILNGFKTNWISTVAHWARVPEELKNILQIPQSLRKCLDEALQRESSEEQNSSKEQEDIFVSNLKPTADVLTKLNNSIYDYCYFITCKSKMFFNWAEQTYEFNDTDRLDQLYQRLDLKLQLYTNEGIHLHPSTPLSLAFEPGRKFLLGGRACYVLKKFGSWKAVDNWLVTLGLAKYRRQFEAEEVDDFLSLPFLRLSCLEDMKIFSLEDRRTLQLAVEHLQDISLCDFVGVFIQHLGFPTYADRFAKELVTLQTLEEKDIRLMVSKSADAQLLWEVIKNYQQMSSVEASYNWLQAHGFEKYAFQFVRYNIPFYALPLVNFFIVGEMAVLGDNEVVLKALRELQDSPAYSVKAMTFWLRDLEMANYSQIFAKSLMVNFIESLTILTDHTIHRFVPNNNDRTKMKTAVREMRELRFYYSTIASLLQEEIIQKYAPLFSSRGIAIEILPLLTDSHLLELGISDERERQRITDAVKKLRDVPSAALAHSELMRPNDMSNSSTKSKFGAMNKGAVGAGMLSASSSSGGISVMENSSSSSSSSHILKSSPPSSPVSPLAFRSETRGVVGVIPPPSSSTSGTATNLLRPSPSQVPPQLLTPTIINNFNEVKLSKNARKKLQKGAKS